ncbi:MAG: type II secretion system F family protein [Sneathiella sp.]
MSVSGTVNVVEIGVVMGIATSVIVAVRLFRAGLVKRRDEVWQKRKALLLGELDVEGKEAPSDNQQNSRRWGNTARHFLSYFLPMLRNTDSSLERFPAPEITVPKKEVPATLSFGWPFGILSGAGLYFLLELFAFPKEMEDASRIVFFCLFAGGGGVAPRYLTHFLKTKRQKKIEGVVPDVIDLLVLSVEAGMTFDAALLQTRRHIADYSKEMFEELEILVAELAVLPERRQAFANLVSRTGSETLRYLSIALQQGEKYGTPISASLKTVAMDSRKRVFLDLEKKAARLPVWLSLPLMLCILPPVVALSVGPGFVSLLRSIGGGG